MAADAQLSLFADAEPEPAPFSLHAVCGFCGAHLDVVPVDGGAGAPWYAASLWCYLAQHAHNRQAHPERVPPEAADLDGPT